MRMRSGSSGSHPEVLNPLGELLGTLAKEVTILRERVEKMERQVQELEAPGALLSVQELATRHPGFTVGGLKWLLFKREENGLGSAVVQSGRKILIDERKFLDWLAKKPGSGTSRP